MSIKVTVLSIFNEFNEKYKRPCSMADFWDYLGGRVSGNRLNQIVHTLREDKLLKSTKSKTNTKYFDYAITRLGQDKLKMEPHNIDDVKTVRAWAGSGPQKVKPTNNVIRYSKSALSAIDSISDIVDTNERLVATIRSIHSQLGQILAEQDDNGGDNEPS